MIKVILLGDCHSRFNVLNEILSSEEPFDLFLMTGDLGILKDYSIINKYKSRGYQVCGNHDSTEIFSRIDISSNILGLHISGLSGLIKTRTFIKDTSNNVSFREILYASHLKDVDILITHQIPYGVIPNMGEKVITELLHYQVPRIAISGHAHKYKLKFYLNTFIISLPLISRGYVVAYFDGKELKNIEIVLKRGRNTIRV